MKPKFEISDFESQHSIKYYQFVTEKYTYMTRTGVNKEGKRTKITEICEPFEKSKEEFDEKGKTYLIHRYEIKNNLFHWPQILEKK